MNSSLAPGLPQTSSLLFEPPEAGERLGQGSAWTPILAKHCYARKQPIASAFLDTLWVSIPEQNINLVIAENLRHYMAKQGLSQMRLAVATNGKVGQTTVSLYLDPERRKTGKSGKASAKMTEVQALADALGVKIWHLLMPAGEREAFAHLEAAYKSLAPAAESVLGEFPPDRRRADRRVSNG